MGSKQGKYTEEYKTAAADRLYEPGATLSKGAKEPGRTPGQLKMWRLEREAAGSQEAKRRQQADAAELTRLRKENKRLEQENEIPQKASAVGRLPQLVLRVPVFTAGAPGPGTPEYGPNDFSKVLGGVTVLNGSTRNSRSKKRLSVSGALPEL